MTSTTLRSTSHPEDVLRIQVNAPGQVFIEIEETEVLDEPRIAEIALPADALRDAIDKAVPPESKPFSIEAQLAESWERAEQGVATTGDLLIAHENGGYSVWTSTMDYARSHGDIRIVKRAPKPEPVQVYVNPESDDDFYVNIGPARYVSAKGYSDQQEAVLIRDGYVPGEVVAL